MTVRKKKKKEKKNISCFEIFKIHGRYKIVANECDSIYECLYRGWVAI